MKKIYFVTILSLLTFSFISCKNGDVASQKIEKSEKKLAVNAKPETAELKIEGMTYERPNW